MCEAVHRTGRTWGRADSSSSNAARGRSSEPLHIYPCRLGREPAATRMLLHPTRPVRASPVHPTHQQICLGCQTAQMWHKRPGVGDFAGRWHEAYDGAAAGPQDGSTVSCRDSSIEGCARCRAADLASPTTVSSALLLHCMLQFFLFLLFSPLSAVGRAQKQLAWPDAASSTRFMHPCEISSVISELQSGVSLLCSHSLLYISVLRATARPKPPTGGRALRQSEKDLAFDPIA